VADHAQLADAGLSRTAIAEIAYCAAANVCANRLATLLAFPSDFTEATADRLAIRLLRPLIARCIRGKLREPQALPAPNAGPCADLVAALDGSPAAGVLRRVIDEAIASPVLPKRTKLLMLAVIGRAVGCNRAESEAQAELATEGFTARDVEQVLANLSSPKLDAREALLVPFARETVRYQVPTMQQRTRELGGRLTREELIEAVGIAALANGVCRLSVILETC
jgi:alkylhydroperoxidase family enzyme